MKPEIRLTRVIFFAAVGVLLISMTVIYWVGLAAIKSNRKIVQEQRVIDHLSQLISSFKDAETGQRGFLLTGSSAYLEPYNRASSGIASELEKLKELADRGELPTERVAEIKFMCHDKISELEQTIKLRRVGNSEEALSIVRSGRGKELMDQLRSKIENLQSFAALESQRATREANESIRRRDWTFLSTALLNVFFLAWAYARITRETRGREAAQQELRASEARGRTILENLMEGVVASDMQGNVLHWNPAALKMHGFNSLKEAQLKLEQYPNLFELSTMDGAVLPLNQWPLSRILKGEKLQELEIRLKHQNEGWQKVFCYGGSVAMDLDGKPLLAVVTINDMTERNRMEEELRQSHAELEQRVQLRTSELGAANKELEAFGYSVSHDLRAPLRHVSGYIKLLEKSAGPSLDEKSLVYIKTISQASERMGHLIDDLLVLSRIGRTTITESNVSLRQLVDDARQLLAPEMIGRVIEWQIGALPQIHGDINLLRSAVLNLLSNAIKYTRLRNPARIEVGSQEKDGEAICFVRDNGAGFDMQYVEKLFGVFQRLHDQSEFEGTGIGLASVRRIIQRHGGKTWAQGVMDQGATFYFTIPKERLV